MRSRLTFASRKHTYYCDSNLVKPVPNILEPEPSPECTALVIFGITGDLAQKKLFTALYDLALIGRLDMPVFGVGRSDWDTPLLRARAGEAIRRAHDRNDLSEEALSAVLACLTYVEGRYDDADLYAQIRELTADHHQVLCYLAVPPTVFEDITNGIAGTDLRHRVRMLIEKPFGTDLASARNLADELASHFDHEQIFAVDHYLQKESLQNVMILRFANRIFEPCWNTDHIQKIDVVMSESFGIDGRAGFFEQAGTLRDVVQNHALQIVAAIAMEAPRSSSARDLNDQRAALLSEVNVFKQADAIFGQYDGYRSVDDVSSTSTTDTYVHIRFTINNDRWRGVLWTITAGKALDRTATEITVSFREAVSPAFINDHCSPDCNVLRIVLAPEESLSLSMQSRSAALSMGTAATTISTDLDYRPYEELQPYARLFDDARRNDHSQFARRDVVEQAWRILEDVLHRDGEPVRYAVGSAGPARMAN
jgi:glucose-6-phosphate 1-dehydrogenase